MGSNEYSHRKQDIEQGCTELAVAYTFNKHEGQTLKDESAYVKGDLTPEDLGNLEISNKFFGDDN